MKQFKVFKKYNGLVSLRKNITTYVFLGYYDCDTITEAIKLASAEHKIPSILISATVVI